MSTAAELTLLVPGLAGPDPAAGADPREVARALLADLALPALARLLGRAESIGSPLGGESCDSLLFEVFGRVRPEDGDWPAAALSRQAHAGDAGEEIWIRCDPVHLRADTGKLTLIAAYTLEVDSEESWALARWLNQQPHFPGPVAEPSSAACWHARLDAVPRIRTRSVREAHGMRVDACLPRGPDATAWHARMNAIQMLLHDCPVNTERAARRQPELNSLWFWGAGTLPAPQPAPFDGACGDHELLSGLGRRGDCPTGPRPGDARRWLSEVAPGRQLVVLDELERAACDADPGAWRDGLAALERGWFAPAERALADGRLATVRVHAGGGRGFVVGRRALRRWWRRPRDVCARFAALRARPHR